MLRAIVGWIPIVGGVAEVYGSPHFVKNPGSFTFYASAIWHGVWLDIAIICILWSIT